MEDIVTTHIRRVRLPRPLLDFVAFGWKQARACVFAGSFFGLLFISTQFDVPGLHRYDLILIGALAIQLVLVVTGLETKDELRVIMLYHVLGFALEAYKTHPAIGSWSYPEDGWTKIMTVPLYSGFMYSAIGSYMAQAWRLLDLRLVRYPSRRITGTLCAAIYLNFFTNAFLPDQRMWLFLAVLVVFARTRIEFRPLDRVYWMPLWVGFVLIAFFVWIAENISTFFGAWQYPDQALGWQVVDLHKIGSWSLLVIISFVLIVDLKLLKAERTAETPRSAVAQSDETRHTGQHAKSAGREPRRDCNSGVPGGISARYRDGRDPHERGSQQPPPFEG